MVKYIGVSIKALIKIKEGFEPNYIGEKARDALNMYLDHLKGGSNGDGWQFGKTVFKSEIYEILNEISGIDSIQEILMISEDGSYSEKIEIPENALVYYKRLDITIRGPSDGKKI